MSKKISFILKIVFLFIIVAWVFLVLIDYTRAKKATKPLICFKETTTKVDNGNYYVCTSFGYKYYEYQKEDNTKDYGFSIIFVKNPIEERINETNQK